MKKEYTSVSIPKSLFKKAEKYLEEEGYISVGELLRELLRNWIRKKEQERQS